MATLNGAISASAELIRVTGTAPEPGAYFTIGSEAIRFLGTSRGPTGRAFKRDYWSVDRGVAGTTKATHLTGATLTRYYPDANSGGSGGGVTVTGSQGGSVAGASELLVAGSVAEGDPGQAVQGLVVQLIGPFAIAFNDADIATSGSLLTLIPSGVLVIRAWPILRSVWTYTGGPGDPIDLQLLLQDKGGSPRVFYQTAIDSLNGTAYPDTTDVAVEPADYRFNTSTGYAAVAQAADEATEFRAYANASAGLTAGTADVYAIIATPAA